MCLLTLAAELWLLLLSSSACGVVAFDFGASVAMMIVVAFQVKDAARDYNFAADADYYNDVAVDYDADDWADFHGVDICYDAIGNHDGDDVDFLTLHHRHLSVAI